MNHTITEQDGVVIFAIDGKANRALFETFQANVDLSKKVVIDCAKAVAFLGDDIEDLVKCHNACEQAGGSLVLAALPKDLGYVINLLSLDQFFIIADNPEEGTKQLAQADAGGMQMTTLRMIAIQKDKLADKAANPEEEAEAMVQQAKVSMRYLAPTPARVSMLRFFEKLGPAELSINETADMIGEDLTTVAEAFARLEGLRVLVPNRRGGLRYSPGPSTRKGIQAILAMWADAGNREKMMQWADADTDGDLIILEDD